ncbi:MAG: hypothetical protein KGL95_14745 [Patescibacteria group bacterium]|nr:hypothetical protein [Patescibacteria group bacterium]
MKNILRLLEDQGIKIIKIMEMLESLQPVNPEQMKTKTPITTQDKNQNKSDRKNKKKPKFAIDILYHDHFFKTGKTFSDVTKKLADDGFHFKGGSVQFALDSAEYLDRKGGKGNYHWLQKYPPD